MWCPAPNLSGHVANAVTDYVDIIMPECRKTSIIKETTA